MHYVDKNDHYFKTSMTDYATINNNNYYIYFYFNKNINIQIKNFNTVH